MNKVLIKKIIVGLTIITVLNPLLLHALISDSFLEGTGIYNGLRDQSLNEGWKLYIQSDDAYTDSQVWIDGILLGTRPYNNPANRRYPGNGNILNQHFTLSNPHLRTPCSPSFCLVQTMVNINGSMTDTFKSSSGICYFNFTPLSVLHRYRFFLKRCKNETHWGLQSSRFRRTRRSSQLQDYWKNWDCKAIRMPRSPRRK